MTGQRVFLDIVFVQALLNRADQLHAQALALSRELPNVAEIWTTEAILTEIGNALSAINRPGVVRFIDEAYRARRCGSCLLIRLSFAALLISIATAPTRSGGSLIACRSS